MVFKAFLKIVFRNQNNNFIRFFKLKEIQYIRSKSNQNGTLIMANLEQKMNWFKRLKNYRCLSIYLLPWIRLTQLNRSSWQLAVYNIYLSNGTEIALKYLQKCSIGNPASIFIRFIHNYLQFNLKQITLYIYRHKACAMVTLTKKL